MKPIVDVSYTGTTTNTFNKSLKIYPRLRSVLQTVVITLIYYLLARIGLALQFEQTQASAVWPPSGFAFAVVLILGFRSAGVGIFLGALLANLVEFYIKSIVGPPSLFGFFMYIVSHGKELAVAASIALGNLSEALAGFYLVNRFMSNKVLFNTISLVLSFVVVALLVCMISATIGVTTLVVGSILPVSLYTPVWFTWWLGDVTGILILTPFLMLFYHYRISTPLPKIDTFGLLLSSCVLLILCMLTFSGQLAITFFQAQAYLLLPVMLIVVVVYGNLIASFTIVMVSVLAIWGTINGYGPFVRDEQNISLILLQGFVSVTAVTTLLLGAALKERASALTAMHEANEQLERRVQQRTKALTKVNNELVRSNKELDDFAYIASHDLKEPLRGIENQVAFILEDYGDQLPNKVVERLNKLTPITTHLDKLIASLLHFSRVGRQDMQHEFVNLQTLLHEIINSIQARLDEIGTQIRIVNTLPTIRCDNIRIGEVFQNLITNAMKYNDKEKKWIEIGIKYDSLQNRAIYVRDNGIGIRERHLKKIFTIFKRLHGKDKYGGGTGAGMTIVKKIVERHGGKIWVESVYGEGTTFYFTLEGLNNELQ